jgi:hypothetical protein
MSLREFLEHPRAGAPDGGPRPRIAAWRTAVSTLVARFRSILGKFQQLRLIDWSVLRNYAGIRYNAEALTIALDENAITLEPTTIDPEPGVLGRVSVNCGVREVHLDCSLDGKLWRYHWVIPRDGASEELTDEAIENVVEELFRSTTP